MFLSQMNNEQQRSILTTGHKVAAKLLLYQFMDYRAKESFDKILLKDVNICHSTLLDIFNRYDQMTTEEQLFLIRTALAHTSESKRTDHINGFSLYWIPNNTNMDIEAIEQEQHNSAANREKKALARILQRELKN